MEDPLDLKLLINQAPNSIASSVESKTFKCDTCNATYTDKMYYELHRQSHQKEVTQMVSKDIPIVQIVQISGSQAQTQAHHQSGPQIIIQDDQTYKRTYGVESQQVYTLAPVTQYQVIAANNRGGTVSISQHNQGNISTYPTPTYVLATMPDGHHQLQALEAVLQPEIVAANHHPQQTAQNLLQQHQPINQDIQQTQNVHAVTSSNNVTRSHRGTVSIKDRPFKCNECTASFIEQEELDEHKKKHTGDGPFTCEDCHFTFMYKSHFRSHKTRCIKKRALNPTATKHIIVNPSPVKRQFPTHQTQQITKQQIQQLHYTNSPIIHNNKFVDSTNTNTRVFTVRAVNKKASPNKFNPSNPTFKRIKTEARLDRPFECNECDASFQSEDDLVTHKSKHTGEDPFKCDECNFVFLYRKLYEAHRRRCEKKRKESDPLHISTQNSSSIPSSVINTDTHHHISQVQQIQQPQEIQLQNSSLAIGVPTSVLSGSMPLHSGGQSVIEMRPVSAEGHEIQQIHVPHQIIEQVVVAPNSAVSSITGRNDMKYEMVPAVGVADAVNGNQIMNLIKVKGSNQQNYT